MSACVSACLPGNLSLVFFCFSPCAVCVLHVLVHVCPSKGPQLGFIAFFYPFEHFLLIVDQSINQSKDQTCLSVCLSWFPGMLSRVIIDLSPRKNNASSSKPEQHLSRP